jgi:hypothetical protein
LILTQNEPEGGTNRHDAFALLADLQQKFQDRSVMYFRSAFHARNGVAFEQETETISAFSIGRYMPSRLVTGIREDLAALGALVALAVMALTEFAAFGPAIVAGRCEISS